MRLDCYVTGSVACELVPAPQDRAWMDASPDRYPYRCLPLNIANAFGWHILSPCALDIEYNGGPLREDIRITSPDPVPGLSHLVVSHFMRGILTFHPGYLFRTDPGWQLLATGPFNWPKDGIAPLTGLVETDWLPFPFTMNWQLTRPGRVRFEKGEPFCQIVPVAPGQLDSMVPQVRPIADDPGLRQEYEAYRDRRNEFLTRLQAGDEETVREAWQKFYFRGRLPTGTKAPDSHASKLRMADPVDLRPGATRPAPARAAAASRPVATADGTRVAIDGLSRRPVPISLRRHEGIGVTAPDYTFARAVVLAPLGAVEMERAANEMPLLFTLDPPGVVAVLGLDEGDNLHVDSGRWDGGYTPAIVRQYPFSLLPDPDRGERLVLALDEACPWLDRSSPRKLLAGGKLTELGQTGAAIADALGRDLVAARDFAAALAERGLLVPAAEAGGDPLMRRPAFAGTFVIDRVRYGALPADVAEDWKRRQWSTWAAHHAVSLGNWPRLAARARQRADRGR
ncbi:MAG: SapC family protein [Alphaproteobacteria bacterium]|nr:SapC family protein [Alphaproteobacteria bacterium]